MLAPRAAGTGAALLWILWCVRWFDAGEPFRPGWLAALSPAVLALPGVVLGLLWLRERWADLRGDLPRDAAAGLALVAVLAFVFRLPLAWHGAVGYTTADAALSGIVALHLREGVAHDVFLPQLPYSGSLKSHLTVLLALGTDLPRAFTLASVAFYAAFVAGLHRLALLVDGRRSVALGAALYAVFAPAFVTHYSLSNDGNYVEVLAFGTWAAVLAARWTSEPARRGVLALGLGLLVGLAFWCHILAVIYAAALGLALLACDARAAVRTALPAAWGFVVGYAPGLLWNAGHAWDSFRSLVPGQQPAAAGPEGPGVVGRALAIATDHLPVLLGYDTGYARAVDGLMLALAWLALAVAAWSLVRAARDARSGEANGLRLLVLLVVVDVALAVLALRYVPRNPRYLLFLMTPVPILLARTLAEGRGRAALAVLVAFGALGSLGQARGEVESDRRWRSFASGLEAAGVRHCHTDFFVATMVNFLTEERVVCSAKLGPNRTEYFFEYRERVEAAPEAALVAPTSANADKIERKLARLGVRYERLDLLKPVFVRLSRKVDPRELFPEQSFGLR
ncbi:MAG: hypothetical protein HY317_00130 [Acidobacteria bacterium]|nr:hypothetical protein [Acidobacteriota bacterium]